MIQEEGVVISVKGLFAEVQAKEKSACSSCSAHNICGDGSDGTRVVKVINNIDAKAGQKVKIEMQSSSLVIGSAVVFLIPTLFLIIGALAGYFIGMGISDKKTGETAGVIAGALGFILSLFLTKYISKRLDKENKFYPEIKEIID